MMKTNAGIVLVALALWQCAGKDKENIDKAEFQNAEPALSEYAASIPLTDIRLPPGFEIAIFAEVKDARSMAMSPDGVLYVGNKDGDKVYAVKDTDNDQRADHRWVVASGLNMPNGVAFKDGDLYVAEVSRILKFTGIESDLDNPPSPIVINDTYPTETHHGWKYIAFGPDGMLYVPVGAPCNICDPEEIYATITRIQPDGSGREIYAHGIRNTVGFTWHPETGELWFTDNGRDHLGNDVPPCELNKAPEAGLHFGYPYCHAGEIKDPEFGDKGNCASFVAPARKLGPHVAPLGLTFYTGDAFPEEYNGDLIIAEHGSWNRDQKIGYRLSRVKVVDNEAVSYDTFADGWLDEEKQEAWGRPVDVLPLADGSLLVSDDKAGLIYRIIYRG